MNVPTSPSEGSNWIDQLDFARDRVYRVIGHVDLEKPIWDEIAGLGNALNHLRTSVEYVRNDEGNPNLTRMAVVTNPHYLEGSGIPPPEAIEAAFNKAAPGVTFRYTPVSTPEGAVHAATQLTKQAHATTTPVDRSVVVIPWTRPS